MGQHLKQQLKYMLILACVIAFMPAACAQEQVVINSGDWRDVYSSMMYANLCGMPASFITDAPHATALPNYLGKNPDIVLVESETSPFFANYEETLTNEGFVVSGTYMSPDGRGGKPAFHRRTP
jgi:putative cell wall-binding protein